MSSTFTFPLKPSVILVKSLTLSLIASSHLAIAADDTAISETLTITARHWQEDPRQSPTALQVDQTQPGSLDIWHDLDAIADSTPNVLIEDSSVQKRLVVRGITAANTGLQDPLGFFVDGVGLPLGANQAPALFNLEQVEFLKGPQGTLYGRNTEAGAIKLITAKPAHETEIWGRVSQFWVDGAQDTQLRTLVSAGVSGPLNSMLNAGLAIRVEEGESGYYNQFDNSTKGGEINNGAISASADLFLSDTTELQLRSRLDDRDSGMERMRFVNGNYATERFTTNYNRSAEDTKKSGVHSATLIKTFDNLELTAITGISHYDRNFVMDLDATILPAPASILEQDSRMLSQEFRLSTLPTANQAQWLVGAYIFRDESDINFTTGVPSTLRTTQIDQDGIALFGQFEMPINDRLRFNAGSRLEYIDQAGQQTSSNMFGNSSYTASHSGLELLPKVGLTYDLPQQGLLYANLTRGYLPGGYNYNLASNADNFSYDAEYSDTAEVGFKTAFLDGRLETDLALFYTRTTDKQVIDLQPGNVQKISNAAEAVIYGLELSLSTNLNQNWQAFSNVGWQQAEAEDYQAQVFSGGSLITADLSGNDLPMAAPYNYSLGLKYDSNSWFGQARLNGTGSFYFDSQNLLEQDAYQTFDMELGYKIRDIKLSLAARNLFDEAYYTRAVSTPNGLLVEDGNAREISLNLSGRW